MSVQRHFHVGQVVRYVTGTTGDVLPYATVVERRGTGRTRLGAPQYLLRRADTGTTVWTSGANVYADTEQTNVWAHSMRMYEALQREKSRAMDRAVMDVSAEYEPRLKAAREALRLPNDANPYRD